MIPSWVSDKIVDSDDDCRVYTGYLNSKGYPKYAGQYLHRLIKAESDGIPMPDSDIKCLHRCDNPPCCNPDHLFWGTQAENMADMIIKGRRAPTQRYKVKEEDIALAISLRESGYSYQRIADKLSITKKHAWNIINGG